MIHVQLVPSPRKDKKWRMVFFRKEKPEYRDFGAKHMSDFTLHRDVVRKSMFLTRFRKLIEKNRYDPFSPMTLSRWILWNQPTIEDSFKQYKSHFGFS